MLQLSRTHAQQTLLRSRFPASGARKLRTAQFARPMTVFDSDITQVEGCLSTFESTPGPVGINLRLSHGQLTAIGRYNLKIPQPAEFVSQLARLPSILETLNRTESITEVIVQLNDVLDVQRNSASSTDFENIMGMELDCIDLGLWRLPELHKITVLHALTERTLRKARIFSTIEEWRHFVLNDEDPAHRAFDYTAEFHSRDFISYLHYPYDEKTEIWPHCKWLLLSSGGGYR